MARLTGTGGEAKEAKHTKFGAKLPLKKQIDRPAVSLYAAIAIYL
jgi:hypothetical protein